MGVPFAIVIVILAVVLTRHSRGQVASGEAALAQLGAIHVTGVQIADRVALFRDAMNAQVWVLPGRIYLRSQGSVALSEYALPGVPHLAVPLRMDARTEATELGLVGDVI